MIDETPEELAARDAVEQAIHEYARVSGWDGVVTDWMVLGATETAEHPDEIGYFSMYPNGTLADHAALGLIAVADAKLRSRLAE